MKLLTKVALFTTASTLLLGGCIDVESTTQEITPESIEVIEISATQLFNEYESNEIAADTKYKDKVLKVSGKISNMGKDIMDDMYISLDTGNFISSVQCMLKDSEAEKAGSLSKGQQITVQGENTGMFMNILLRKCEITL